MDALRKAINDAKKRSLVGPVEDHEASKRVKEVDSEDVEEDDEEVEVEAEDESKTEPETKTTAQESNAAPNSPPSASAEASSSSQLEGTSEKLIINWLEEVLAGWVNEVSHMQFRTAKDRAVLAAVRECETNLAPLLIQLRQRTFADRTLLANLEAIVIRCREREYRRALDHYIQITIGNAAWPIGVTMVGIHARSGREKISEDKVKHVMKSPEIRAYMMAIKRLMTRCQAVHPPDAPSKAMN